MSTVDKCLLILNKKIPPSIFLEDALRVLEKRGTFYFGEVSDLGKTLIADFIKGNSSLPVVFITENTEDYKKRFEEWGIDYSLVGDAHVRPLRGGRKIFLADFKTMLRKVISPEQYENKVLNLAIGDELSFANITGFLTDGGYERVKNLSDIGEFSIKGDLLEIFCFDGKYRLEFLGDRVEKIMIVGSGRDRSLQNVKIYPRNIDEGNDFLIKYFKNNILIFDGEDNLRSSVFSILVGKEGKISPEDIKKIKEIEDFVKRQKTIYLESFAVDESGGLPALPAQAGQAGKNLKWFGPKNYYGNTKQLINDFKSDYRSSAVILVSERAEGLKKFLIQNEINTNEEKLIIEKGRISEGINFSSSKLIVLSDKEIFGEIKQRKHKKIDFSALTKLKKGEFVVHLDHGIGVFTGFGEISIDGIKREYIFIEYAGGDKIYVPLDQADKITKYISVGNAPPHLSSLKTAHWLKIRKKVVENTEKTAKELLETQALRQGEKPFHYYDDFREQKILAKSFPYEETPDQRKAIEEVLEDMKMEKPMDRLVCGDVGYGKTEVAIRAAAKAVVSGGQVAILVPTTILAEQHLQTFRERFEDIGIKVESLSRFKSAADQKRIIEKINNGPASTRGVESTRGGGVDVVIGTHRLLSSDIKFKNLYLIIIDEEQKFGVKHKEKLKKLRSGCDILVMTATPIPRTLYLGLSGLKDISVIVTPPEGRLPIKTIVIKNDEEVIKSAITKEVERGGQVYFVHNRVETITALENKLKKLLPKVKFEIGHGKMGEEKLAHVMNDFAAGKFQVLICSTIIESGLDISTVNTLIVDKATHFGLAQLHQLRGRIGRSDRQAYAYLLYDSNDLKGNAQRRLKTITEKGDLGSGYELSLEDLDIRGSGNILGKEQHGSMQMVGVGYYLRLLEEAVERLRGEKETVEIKEVKIELPISAYIPDGFYGKEEEKIRTYQSLAGLEELEEVKEFINGLKNTFGEIPQEFLNLVNIVRLKIKARKAGIKSMIVKDVLGMGEKKVKKLYIDFDHILTKEEVECLFSFNAYWYFGNTQIKIDLDKLGRGTEWFKKLDFVLEKLKK